jgi:transposase
VLEAVLWILNTGAQWHMLPQSYPNYKTVHRRFQAWCRDEILRRLLTDVGNELRDRGALDEEECFIDATFVMAKGGGTEIGATKRGKGMKSWRLLIAMDGIEMIAPHRANRSKPPTQDRRRLTRDMRRWFVERFFAWMQWQRRILVRWEYHTRNFLGFVQLACLVILFRRF